MLDKGYLSSCSRFNRLLVLASLALLAGCASSVVVKPDIPNPLVAKLPLKTSLVYSKTFKNYVYVETEKKRNSMKSIDFTEAQTAMFQQVFGSLTSLVEPTDPSKNLSIEPEILDFQYTAPSETKLKQYEIWIKYRLKLRNANDARVADWIIKGYGKTPTGMLTSATSAFSAATNVALRDVGAQLSIRFPQQSVVKTLLAGGAPPIIPEPEPKPEPEQKPELVTSDVDAEQAADFLDELTDELSNELPIAEQDEIKSSASADDIAPASSAENPSTNNEGEAKVVEIN